MAEGFAKALKGNELDSWSAGIEAKGLNLLAVKVMAEVGVDISQQTSKTVDALTGVVSSFLFHFIFIFFSGVHFLSLAHLTS